MIRDYANPTKLPDFNTRIMKKFITLLFLLAGLFLQAQDTDNTAGAKAAGMGLKGTGLQDFWAIFNNQAGAAAQESFSAGVYIENPYMLVDLRRIAAGLLWPAGRGSLFINASHSGGSLYSKTKAGVGYARAFGKHFSAGIQLDYLHMGIGEGYGHHHALTFEGGIMTLIGDKLVMGMHVFNPAGAGWNKTEERIPVQFMTGLAYEPDPSLTLSAEIGKSTAGAAVFAAGCEYRYHERFFIRAGIGSGPARYSFGAGIVWKNLLIDIASSIHSYLGYSPQLSFTWLKKQ
jgi:hypothetical protein